MTTPADSLVRPRYIADQARPAHRTYTLRSPVHGQAIAEVADCGPEEAKAAVDLAVLAFDRWSRRTAFDRAGVMRAWHDLIVVHTEELAGLITLEMGKPIKEARGEVAYTASYVRFYGEEATRIHGETLPSPATHKRIHVYRQPVGPVFAITPWNFPTGMIARKAAPALAAGCSLILKPAEQTPLSALRLAELWLEAGGEPGSFQVLTVADPVEVSATVIADPRIRKLTFTGSTEVGKLLYRQAADTVKRLSLELGGHAPLIVFDDADLDRAVVEAMGTKFRNAGQTCVCSNRIFVQNSVHEAFTARFVAAAERLRVGDPFAQETDLGPLVSGEALKKVQEHVNDAVAQGARLLTGGRVARDGGLWFQPTVLTDVVPTMRIMHEETFGPVAPIVRFDTEQEAVTMANDSAYGLASYVFTQDLGRAHRVSEALQYGIVGVNDGVPAAAHVPYGGVKESGLGREGGRWGMEDYLDIKYVSVAI